MRISLFNATAPAIVFDAGYSDQQLRHWRGHHFDLTLIHHKAIINIDDSTYLTGSTVPREVARPVFEQNSLDGRRESSILP
jgi:hypothetical protein